MRLLALDTSGSEGGSVALLDAGELVLESSLPPGQRAARALAPTIAAALQAANWRAADVELLAVTVGPGSFTGLRIGVTTAKTLAYAVGCPILGLETTEIIAAAADTSERELAVVLDAQRGELYAARFVRGETGWRRQGPTQIVPAPAFLAGLPHGCAVTGPALTRLRDQLPPQLAPLPANCWTPQASALGRCAWRAWQRGERHDLWTLAPRYLRRSAAEEKWERDQALDAKEL